MENGDDIVISGVSGRFPNSRNLDQLSYNLFNKIDMVDEKETRWRHTNAEVPRRMGKTLDIEKFDASFFGVNYRHARTMDPQGRIILEHAFESILDAGISPKTLKGKNVGVFIGASYNESEMKWIYEKFSKDGLGIVGSARAMLANRISFSLGFVGPSFTLDTACSSSMYALDVAYKMLRSGEIEAALVGGSNLCLHPHIMLQFIRLGVVSRDGYCRPFDKNASGYTRAEASCIFFLQKRKHAKRVYATVMHSKTNCDGFKEEGINFPSHHLQAELMKNFYEEVGISPSDPNIGYFEAHCTGTKVGDPEECRAIEDVMCKGRKDPLYIGSVKSNMGHAEPGAGVCSMSKILLALEHMKIPPNLNLTEPKPEISGITNKKMKVVQEVTDLKGPMIACNSFGFGGANAHALFKANGKTKINHGIPKDNVPRIVTWSGRTQEAITAIMDSVTKHPLDAEYIGLLHNSQRESVNANLYKGYGIFKKGSGTENAICVKTETQHFSGFKRPMVWVYTGMGSQWCQMGADLMKIPMFAASIEKSHNLLASRGLNLKEIITSSDPKIFENILYSFVGIAAIQVALTDILKALELSPDFIIGHSVGELGCAYADECFTAEETIISAYSRGLVSLETKVIHGSMAAVGLGYTQLKDIVPEGIEIACHNSSESSTISGPADKIAAFVDSLKEKKIFAKEVECSHIPYHSSYIKEMGPILYKRLKEVIKTNKKRSNKWITSSVPASQQHIEYYQSSSAEYQINNLVNPVLFEETLAQLPKNAILIEISPHGLLQAILKRSMVDSINIPLTQRGNSNNDEFFIGALGKIFCNGFDINVSALYPPVEFPVSRGTPMISPNIKWDHSDDHYVMRFDDKDDGKSSSRKVTISLGELEYEFIKGHCIDGRCIFPATGYLFLAWETLAMMKGLLYFDISVEFEDVKFLRATSMSNETDIEFTIVVHPGTGRFEISEGTSSLVTGVITEVDNPRMKDIKKSDVSPKSLLASRDFYKELRLRGYHYNDLFRSVVEGSFDGKYGKILWDSNWIAFLDCLLQLKIIGRDTRSLILPTGIQKMTINTKKHLEILSKFPDGVQPVYEAFINPELKAISCGGIEIINMQASVVGRRKPPGIPVLETYEFIPYNSPKTILSMNDACRVLSQLYIENHPTTVVKVVEIDGNNDKNMILEDILDALLDLPLITSDMTYLSSRTIDETDDIKVLNETIEDQEECGIIITSSEDNSYSNKLSDGGFLVIRGECKSKDKALRQISTIRTENEVLSVFQKVKAEQEQDPVIYYISEKDTEFKWIEDVKALIPKGPLILLTENEPTSGLIGLVNCLRREPGGTTVRCVFIDDRKAPKFDLKHPLYSDQLNLGLAINVYRSKQWGSFRHLKINPTYVEKPALGHCYGNSLVKSDLSSLKWLQGPLELSDENIVRVHFASLNFKDVMLATGKISADVFVESRIEQDCVLGFEYSGIDRKNKRVMGMVAAGSLASYIPKDPLLSWEVPDNWTLEEAATVPCVYGTVYYAFFIIAQIKRGKSILIHAGTGGIGLSAIRVAFAYGLDVYTTVSTEEKKNFLLKEFPQLKRENIGNSRDVTFEDMIMNRTGGKGVDYVLNSLAEEKLQASIRCLGKGGKFLEIGKFDMEKGTKIGMECFLNEISIHSVMLDKVLIGLDADKMVLRSILENDIQSGVIKPLKTNIFPANQIEQAFRFLASGKHMGKVILQIRKSETDNPTLPITVLPRVYCHPKFTYIIPGGLGGFGLELADWLVLRGCKNLVLSSSRGITKPYQAYRIKTWESYGVTVVVNTSNITSKEGCEKLILAARELGPVGGIFNLAVVLRDGIFENQDATKFNESMAPKAVATKYLDEISRVLCPKLQYFVVFSSVSCGRGNAGQSNYGMANSVMERVMEQRHSLGLPAKAIQWGAVGEVGLVADLQEDLLDMEIGGTLQQRISSCLEELDTLMTVNQPIVGSMVVAEKRYASSKSGNVFEVILNIMGIRDAKSVSMETTLAELGMDSLMLVEIQQTLEREYNFVITAQDLRSMTLNKLIESVGSKEGGEKGKDAELGVHMLIRNLGDEANSKETLICLSENKNTNRLNLFFPGVEGCGGDVWKLVAKRMTGSSYMFQHKNIANASSVNEFVSEIYSKVLNLFNEFADIHLIGYSFGSIIVLKLAEMLEQQHKVPKVTLIDGSPIFLNTLVRDHLVTNNFEEIIETLILKTVVEGTMRGENSKVIHILQSKLSLVEKISALVNEIDGLKIYSESHIAEMIKVILDRSRLIYNLNINEFSLLNKVKIKLIRPQSSALKNLENDYGLTRYSTHPVDVRFVNGDHLSMLDTEDFRNILSEDL
ncbi:fatty acid synthase-like [Chironomus tepperi]|uniref:fatty acid synthase-like n=1 Tax=Chironomus tepperi TaxID=113505 RepID=UPI00391EE1FA